MYTHVKSKMLNYCHKSAETYKGKSKDKNQEPSIKMTELDFINETMQTSLSKPTNYA
jgi:hypothetical protein